MTTPSHQESWAPSVRGEVSFCLIGANLRRIGFDDAELRIPYIERLLSAPKGSAHYPSLDLISYEDKVPKGVSSVATH